jgi:hypothetical protein
VGSRRAVLFPDEGSDGFRISDFGFRVSEFRPHTRLPPMPFASPLFESYVIGVAPRSGCGGRRVRAACALWAKRPGLSDGPRVPMRWGSSAVRAFVRRGRWGWWVAVPPRDGGPAKPWRSLTEGRPRKEESTASSRTWRASVMPPGPRRTQDDQARQFSRRCLIRASSCFVKVRLPHTHTPRPPRESLAASCLASV